MSYLPFSVWLISLSLIPSILLQVTIFHSSLWLSSIPLEKAVAPHSSSLAWKIPWTEEPGRLQSMGSRRVGHNWATSLSFFTFMHWRRKWQPTPVFLPGESQGWGSLVGLLSMRSRRVRLDWSDLEAAVFHYVIWTASSSFIHLLTDT